MSEKHKIPGTDEAWESGKLGTSQEHARPVSHDLGNAIDESLGLQMISIRLDKELISTFKMLAEFHGIGYQPLMRDALKRFADAELKAILAGAVESQKATEKASKIEEEAKIEEKVRRAA